MPNYAYFINCINQEISVNLNSALTNRLLSDLDPTVSINIDHKNQDNPIGEMKVSITSFLNLANLDKDSFGGSPRQVNIVEIHYALEANSFFFGITPIGPNSLTGQDLYFYVFNKTLVGKNSFGISDGIKIDERKLDIDNNSRALTETASNVLSPDMWPDMHAPTKAWKVVREIQSGK